MIGFIKHTILNNSFLLSAGRCIFWEEKKALILSDLHFGKTGHFRKHGIAVPQTVFKEDMQRLIAEVQYFKAEQLIIVGDLFHSHANKEMEWFLKWRNDFAQLNIKLIIGNHDILGEDWYEKAKITCIKHQWQSGPFIFTHDKAEFKSGDDCYTFSGHIHPAVTIHGNARQSLKFPCFYFTKTYGVLPAFGRFTGVHTIKPRKGDTVFVLVENKILLL
ncbi:MAG: ligase-associated DNA damage response endonuclease PdeM [Ferruginibacter sp.]